MNFLHNLCKLSMCLAASYIIIRGILGTAYDVVNWLLKLILVSTNE